MTTEFAQSPGPVYLSASAIIDNTVSEVSESVMIKYTFSTMSLTQRRCRNGLARFTSQTIDRCTTNKAFIDVATPRNFCADLPWPWLGPPLVALRYVMYFRFYG